MSFTNVYKLLGDNLEEDPSGLLYCVLYDGNNIRGYELMSPEKTETIRIDNSTVEDVHYLFDLDAGDYVEQSREQRQFPDPNAISPVDAKISELNAACNAAILAGFTSNALGTDNTYDFDYDAQINLGGMLNAITADIVSGTVVWKASGIPQTHTIDQFKTVFAQGLSHKNTNIGKYWTLKGQVLSAETTEEINAIHW
ncbi:hypothetical protein PAECIP111891_06712 [Paenibacillus allorhizoplanae]|uniref:DUF4376 domain-containing protein n=1 Tax=Paenibacillus allorhizoplanae TaxID=2905648 RepID=A0ABN8H5K4_9BACL|nr:DUF4376 domain-containing protein [Paenibacillus allorhizoplanae]CAH1230656.1 hypothetical protein PAECIP111891_06712 [Paenibacillus allorhizoplanae]